jgi:hypothetical protein
MNPVMPRIRSKTRKLMQYFIGASFHIFHCSARAFILKQEGEKKKNYRITVLFQANEVKVVYACNASIPFLYLSLLEEGANKTFS